MVSVGYLFYSIGARPLAVFVIGGTPLLYHLYKGNLKKTKERHTNEN
jgi:hypothetical protein